MSYQQSPDDQYQQQTRPSFTPHRPSQPQYPQPQYPQPQYPQPQYPQPQGQQPSYQQPQQPPPPQQQQYGPSPARVARHQRIQPLDQSAYPAQTPQQGYPAQPPQQAYPAQPPQQGYPVQAAPHGRGGHRHTGGSQAGGKQYGLRGAEVFWYILGCVYFGAAYFSKLPGKKAACEVFSELQLDGQGPSSSYSLRGAESFWYVIMCLAFGSGYFAKVSAKKALWEFVGMVKAAPAEYAQALGRALSGPAAPGVPAAPAAHAAPSQPGF